MFVCSLSLSWERLPLEIQGSCFSSCPAGGRMLRYARRLTILQMVACETLKSIARSTWRSVSARSRIERMSSVVSFEE